VLEEHINKTFTYPQEVASVCKSFDLVKLQPPPNLTKADYKEDMGKNMMWETTMKPNMKGTEMMESDVRGIYAIVWGQSSPMMQLELESLDD
jgi:hypothetical protein